MLTIKVIEVHAGADETGGEKKLKNISNPKFGLKVKDQA